MPTDHPLTTGELEAMKARCERATAGPWIVRRYLKPSFVESLHIVTGSPEYDANYALFRICDWEGSENDSTFVINARTDLPRCIAEIERLNEIVNRVHGAIRMQTASEFVAKTDIEILRLRSDLEVAREALENAGWDLSQLWITLGEWIDEDCKEKNGHYLVAGYKDNPFGRCVKMQDDVKEALSKLSKPL